MKNWFSIKNRSNDVLDISIHDEIGLYGVSAGEFIKALREKQNVKSVNLSIHSPGGSVLDGLAMYNALKAYPAKIYAKVEGLAASAASFVLMAADHIEMPEDSFLMIHNTWGMAVGDADELREMADVMDKMQASIINIYSERTGIATDDIAEMMRVETWMNAAEALDHGFIDTITDRLNVAAKIFAFNKYFKSMPVKNEVNIDGIDSIRDYEKALRDSGVSKGLATALVSRAKVIFKGDPENHDAEFAVLSARLANFKI